MPPTTLYCLVTDARCEQLTQVCYAALSRWELNPRLIDRKSNTLPLRHCVTSYNGRTAFWRYILQEEGADLHLKFGYRKRAL